jgi:hypothetical protein
LSPRFLRGLPTATRAFWMSSKVCFEIMGA